jgi:two pore calcium channel protein 1/two pore calcium channel protein 3
MRICENLRSLLEDDSIEYRRIVDDFTLSLNNLGKNFEMDITNIDVNSTCILY